MTAGELAKYLSDVLPGRTDCEIVVSVGGQQCRVRELIYAPIDNGAIFIECELPPIELDGDQFKALDTGI